jgi:hypothetical protein
MKTYTPTTLQSEILALLNDNTVCGLTVHELADRLEAYHIAVAEQLYGLSQAGEIIAAGTRYCSVIGCDAVTFYVAEALEEVA